MMIQWVCMVTGDCHVRIVLRDRESQHTDLLLADPFVVCHRSAALHKSTPSAASESRRCDLTYLTRNKTDSRFRVGPSGLVDDSALEITARTPTLKCSLTLYC